MSPLPVTVAGAGSRSDALRLRFVVYGRNDPQIQATLRDPRFSAIVEGLASDGASRAPTETNAFYAAAVRLGLLAGNHGACGAGPNLIIIRACESTALRALIAPGLRSYSEIIRDAVPEVAGAYESLPVSARFPWATVTHSVIAGMMMDLLVVQQLRVHGLGLGRDHSRSLVWAIVGPDAPNAFGVQSVRDADQRGGLAQLWHCRVARAALHADVGLVHSLQSFARGAELDLNASRLLLRHQRLIHRDGTAHRLSLPLFDADAMRRLLPPLVRGASRIVSDAIAPILMAAGKDAYWCRVTQDRGYQHGAVRLVLEQAVDQVIETGALPRFPMGPDVPSAWGRWLWREPLDEPQLTLDVEGVSEGERRWSRS